MVVRESSFLLQNMLVKIPQSTPSRMPNTPRSGKFAILYEYFAISRKRYNTWTYATLMHGLLRGYNIEDLEWPLKVILSTENGLSSIFQKMH